MPTSPPDIQYRLSGGAGNSSPAQSLGGAMSATQADASIFPGVDAVEAAAGSLRYICLVIFNNSSTAQNVKLWVNSDTPSASTQISLGAGAALPGDPEPVAAAGAAPAGVLFSDALGEEQALDLGVIAAGAGVSVWVRRAVLAMSPVPTNLLDPFTLSASAQLN